VVFLAVLAIFSVFSQPNRLANSAQALTVPVIQSVQTGLPNIEAIYNLGVPTGNVAYPRHLVLDSQAGQLYIFSQDIPRPGNALSGYNLKTGEFSQPVQVNQGDNEPLDLQLDPTASLIYALWQGRYEETPPVLTVIDSQTLQASQDFTGVEAIAAADGRLYTANQTQLTRLDISGKRLQESQRATLPLATTGPLAFNPIANRLYLARAVDGVWNVEIFTADTLAPVASYPAESPVLNILPLPANDEVLVVVAQGDFRVLYRLTSDGELAGLPYELGPNMGAGIALSTQGDRLFFSNGQSPSTDPTAPDNAGPALIGLSSGSDLTSLHNIPLLTNVDDLVIDDEANQAFGLNTYEHLLYAVDLASETVEIINTSVTVRDVLVDSGSNQLFVSDSANRVRRLDLETLKPISETRLAGNLNDYGFKSASWAGELALDRPRNQLYISGFPATVLSADTLAELDILEPGGQLAPDPAGDNVYLSNCGVTILDAETLTDDTTIPGSASRPDGLSPNPCAIYSRLDSTNQLLYSLVSNGVPGSNAGSYLYVYDLSLEPTLIFSDTDISLVGAEPDPTRSRAFVSYIRFSNRRLRSLDTASKPIHYTHQLLGVWGEVRYSPATNRLYLGEVEHNRLLTLDADSLEVIGEMALPLNGGYRLVEFDPETERLYLVGLDGQLLVASTDPSAAGAAAIEPSAPPRPPDGSILTIVSRQNNTLARIESSYGEYFLEPRLYASPGQGQTWHDLSQNLPGMPIQALAVSPDYETDQTLFAGLLRPGQSGGLYKSTDGGQSWIAAMNGLRDMWVEALFVSPDFGQSGLIFAKTSYAGLHQSNDGGQTWQPLVALEPNSLFPIANKANAVAFSDNGVVLTSQVVGDIAGLFRATHQPDGLLSDWQPVFDIPAEQLALSPDGQVALAFGNGLWRSVDGGATWEAGGAGLASVDNLQPGAILFSPTFAQDKTIYFFFNDPAGELPGRLFRSTDLGQNWQPWIEPEKGQIFTSVALPPAGDFLFGDNVAQLTRLAPDSLSWSTPTEPTTVFPLDDLAISPSDGVDQTLFALSSQYGLYKSGDGGQSWTLTGFPVRVYGFSLKKYQLALSPAYSQDETLYVATGRSLHRSRDGGISWEQLHRAETGQPGQQLSFQAQQIALWPDFARDQTLLASTPVAIYRSTDAGDTWQEVLNSGGESSTTDILAFSPNAQSAYARFGYSFSLYKSNDAGLTWQAQPGAGDELFAAISSAVAADETLTVAVEYNKQLLQTGPQTQPWRDLSQALPAELADVTTVAVGPPGTLLIGGQGGVYRTTDNGQSWQALPDDTLPADTAVSHLRLANGRLFVATADGRILTLADNETSWTDISIVK
jgi:photosystem II stability/assembly factor-like uncharacterized protein/DNA-binding beta-propeller fold protein YncE